MSFESLYNLLGQVKPKIWTLSGDLPISPNTITQSFKPPNNEWAIHYKTMFVSGSPPDGFKFTNIVDGSARIEELQVGGDKISTPDFPLGYPPYVIKEELKYQLANQSATQGVWYEIRTFFLLVNANEITLSKVLKKLTTTNSVISEASIDELAKKTSRMFWEETKRNVNSEGTDSFP